METISRHCVDEVPNAWLSIWTSLVTIDHEVEMRELFFRPLKMLMQPAVLFAVFIYGTSLAAQVILMYVHPQTHRLANNDNDAFSFAFPNLLLAPPYLFSGVEVGLMQIAALIGFIIACYAGGYLADVITAIVIRKQKGIVYSEQRLIALLPFSFVAPAGCIVIACACSQKLHWVAIAFGFGMGEFLSSGMDYTYKVAVSFGTIFAPNIAITYVVESYPKFAAESLVAINVFKNLVAFLFLYTAVDWVASSGWVQVYMILFMLVTLGTLLAIPFYFFGRRWRGETETDHI